MAQNRIWILKGETFRELAARLSWNKRIRNLNVEEACKFFQTTMPKLQTRSTPKDKHSKKKKVGGDVLEVSRGGIKRKE